jgi:hypothetical protein
MVTPVSFYMVCREPLFEVHCSFVALEVMAGLAMFRTDAMLRRRLMKKFSNGCRAENAKKEKRNVAEPPFVVCFQSEHLNQPLRRNSGLL